MYKLIYMEEFSVATSTSHLVQEPRLYYVNCESVQAHGPWQWQVGACASQTVTAQIRKMVLMPVVIILLFGRCLAAPADDPIRIDLQVYDKPETSSDVQLSQALAPENYPGGEPLNKNAGGNLVTYKLQAASNLIGSSFNAKASAGIFSPPVSTLESAIQETEGLGSRKLSFKENIQGAVAGLFQPKPIVDTISEEEKYGNTGDKFYTAGRAIVGGAEGLSNFVNSVLEVPGAIFKQISRAATEKLNNFGGKLIGL